MSIVRRSGGFSADADAAAAVAVAILGVSRPKVNPFIATGVDRVGPTL